MAIDSDDDIRHLKAIGRICAQALRTVDNTAAAQFEHTVIVTKHAPIVLTL